MVQKIGNLVLQFFLWTDVAYRISVFLNALNFIFFLIFMFSYLEYKCSVSLKKFE